MSLTNRLLMRGIRKEYPGVCALDGVDFEVAFGEVHALLGVNGAGKSTLMSILSGATRMDGGAIFINGKRLDITSPHKAMELGISVIYQEFNLVPHLTVAENIFLGREPRKRMGFVDYREMYTGAVGLLERLGAPFSPRERVADLGVAQQQLVEIAKALFKEARVIAMDEPTATLSMKETERLFSIIRLLKAEGKGIVYISHRLEEIFEIADRVTVLRDGRLVETCGLQGVTRERLVEMMLGKALEGAVPGGRGERPFAPTTEHEVLRVEGLTRRGVLEDINLTVMEGEILGIAGLVGAGKTELARALYGLDKIDEGKVVIGGHPVRLQSPAEAIRRGVVLVPEDRKRLGLVLGMAVRENISLASLFRFSRFGFVNGRRERKTAGEMVESLRVKTPGLEQQVRNLSGGNQQKVVLAKWLLRGARVLIFDEPTRGIDVGAKAEVHGLIRALADKGAAILLISSELQEVIDHSDRMVVMHGGRITGELRKGGGATPGQEATPERVLFLAMGGNSGQ
ncbi:MAG: D-xylose ABC transporter ATP-binding protein [Planctomycetes bacterium RIFCSPHIGHO2_02_FULL_52_58]|nr:MAG: D-xylose ABC transporter ATP-binding protein [Planctomycetes bacterium RIFCSPHIGHO2_02_FULL_52_58]